MAETSVRESPLGPLKERLARNSGEKTVVLREAPFLAQIDLRGDPNDKGFLDGVENALGVKLPANANEVVIAGDVRALWLGPDEWLIVGPEGAQDRLFDKLESTLAGRHRSIVDVSGHRTALEIFGSHARDVLEKGCYLDLHPHAFEPGRCVGTIIAKTQVILEQTDNKPSYRLYVRASFARHLTTWLLDAMVEFVR